MGSFFEIGFLVFMVKEPVLSAHFEATKNTRSTFTDQSRNKFGKNNEILIY